MKVRGKGFLNEEIQYSRNEVKEVMTDVYVITEVRGEGNGRSAFLSQNYGSTEYNFLIYSYCNSVNKYLRISMKKRSSPKVMEMKRSITVSYKDHDDFLND